MSLHKVIEKVPKFPLLHSIVISLQTVCLLHWNSVYYIEYAVYLIEQKVYFTAAISQPLKDRIYKGWCLLHVVIDCYDY